MMYIHKRTPKRTDSKTKTANNKPNIVRHPFSLIQFVALPFPKHCTADCTSLSQMPWCTMFIITSIFILCCGAITSADDDGWHRATRLRRQYYDDSYYGSYYGWQAGRIVGWLIGFLVLMLIICVPCVCCVGIWFLGWFGVRQAMASRRARHGEEEVSGRGRVMTARDQQEISRRYLEAPATAEQRYVYATDRVYAAERRPRTPPAAAHEGGGSNTAYASNGVTREVRRL